MKTMHLKTIQLATLFLTVFLLLSACSVIHPGQAGLDVHYGKVKNILLPGPHHPNILGTKVVRLNTRVHEYAEKIKFPTQEGIEVTSEIILLYHFIPDSIKSIYLKFGTDYQNTVIINNLITAIRQTGLNYKATQLIIERGALENSIREKLNTTIGKYGFVVDLMMIKDIDLPADVVSTIQAKLQAEEIAKKTEIDNQVKRKQLEFQLEKEKKEAELEIVKQRLVIDFSIEKQKKESERLLIEADAVRKQQEIISSSLTDRIIKYKALEITRDLVKSGNTKVIIMDGKSPVIIDSKDK